MSTCPDPSTGTTGCEPPFPPVTPTPEPVTGYSLCRCDQAIAGLTGVASFDNSITGNGFLVDVFVRKDTASSGTVLEDAFFLKWPASVSGDHYTNDNTTNCGFRPTLVVQRGQWVVFRQQDPLFDMALRPAITIATTLDGNSVDATYAITTDGNLAWRNRTQIIGVENYRGLIDDLAAYQNDPCPLQAETPCLNVAFQVPACAPDVLYYRHYSEDPTKEIEGGIILVSGSLPGFECTGVTGNGCEPRDRPWNDPLTPLSLGDTFYEWFVITNKLIAAVDPLRVYDVKPLGGLEEVSFGSNGVVYLQANVGDGLRIYPPVQIENGFPAECGDGKIVLDIFGLPEVQITGAIDPFEDGKSRNQVNEQDLFVFERFVEEDGTPSRRGIDPLGTPPNLYKVKAEYLLPYTVAGDHRFTGKVFFENPVMEINATKVTIDDKAIELGASPLVELTVTLVSGTAAQLITGMSHDPDGDSYYYESAGNETDGTTPGNTYSGVTGELIIQGQVQYSTYARSPVPDPNNQYPDFTTGPYLERGPGYNPSDVDGGGTLIHQDVAPLWANGGIAPELTGTEYSRGTIVSVYGITGSTAKISVRPYNDVPFKAGSAYTSRTGVQFNITAIAGQAGTDADINGGGLILNSQNGNKSILWANATDAWTFNQNIAIDNNYHIVTPFNISSSSGNNYVNNSLGVHNYWKVDQVLDVSTITGDNCLTGTDNGLLHFAYVPSGVTGSNVDLAKVPALSILPCGGIYIHNISCSPQFTTSGGDAGSSIVVTTQNGIIDGTLQDKLFISVTGGQSFTDFDVGDVVGMTGNGTLFLAKADNRDNAEVLGIVTQVQSGNGSSCDAGTGGGALEGWIVAVGNLINWTAGMCGLSDIVPGSVYFLNPITGGTLVDCEPLDVGQIRKPVAIAVSDSQLFVTNYEGVVNGDYFQENPILQIADLRDVDTPTTGPDALQDGQILVWNGTTQMWENRDNTLTVYQQTVTGNNNATLNDIVVSFGPQPLAQEIDLLTGGSMFVCDFELCGSVFYRPSAAGAGTPNTEGWFYGSMSDLAFRLDGTGTDTGTFTAWTTTASSTGSGNDLHLDATGLWDSASSVVFSINQATREITCTVTIDPGGGTSPRSIGKYNITARMTNVRVIPMPTATA